MARSYISTVTDLRKIIREEVDDERKQKLLGNLARLDEEYNEMRETITNLRIAAANNLSGDAVRKIVEDGGNVLSERIKSLDYLVKKLLIAVIVEVIGGAALAYIVHGIRP